MSRRPGLLAGILLLLAVIAGALLASVLTGPHPLDMVARPYQWPGSEAAHPLGTDMLGRDLLAGILHGARFSLLIGLAAGLLAALCGLLVGSIAGYFGGAVDALLMRLTDIFQTMPSLVFTIVLVVILRPTVASIVLGIAVTGWPNIARLVRAEALRLRASEFVAAARLQGLRHGRILWLHVLPNVLTPALVMVSILIGHAILTEASLSFLGLGDPNIASWGSMIGSGREVLRTAWYMTALPGAAIFLTVVALNLIGNGLTDLLNPRQRGAF
ncbi:ABC transporter permease subunit [Xylophilus rhododendri]|uniref:ABC transporter permease subunit n=1 Tax=Xylophilus rhododendri TaxID=2697032 RepID=A0A857JBK1_9BURK|nr:ABC transporter permease [Xylophilus rhododendri]QHJ01317.1 ABC transporter permease subunit [Xylophilus rhododendri]